MTTSVHQGVSMRQRAALAAVVVTMAWTAAPADAAPSCAPVVERVAGGTWETRPVAGLEGAGWTFEMAADEEDPRLLVVSDTVGVLVSRDGGCRWKRTLVYGDVFPPGRGVDVEVVGSGAERSLHVLLDSTVEAGYALVSSFDDGRTWNVRDLPPLTAVASVDLVASPASRTLFVFARTEAGTGTVYAGAESGDGWRWSTVTQGSLAGSACAPGGPCTAPTLQALSADPAQDGTLWGFGWPQGLGHVALVRSADQGASWEEVAAPEVAETTALFDAAPGRHASLMLLGVYDDFAVSRDGGRSWAVGQLPRLVEEGSTSRRAFELAHFDRGSAFAIVLGQTDSSAWAGNLLVFDDRGWTNVSPPDLIGYDRTDEEGRRLTFVELASSRGSLLALTSAGELMTFRR
ncbi:MAG TPA: sialidase family protein [Actinomycetota bacterium]|nr:sialidase family protein [Actinomycetota bacterium]